MTCLTYINYKTVQPYKCVKKYLFLLICCTVALLLKGRICHFVKCQMRPFNTKVTIMTTHTSSRCTMVYELQVWFHLLTRSYTYVIALKLYFLIHRKIVCSTISVVLLPGDFGPNRSHHHCTCASLQATFVYLEPWETNQVITAFPSRRPS